MILIPRQPIAKNALTILINLSSDEEVLKCLAEDDDFIETLLFKLTVCYYSPLSPLIPPHVDSNCREEC